MECPQCGNPREVCSDPDRPWYPQRHVCYASRAKAVADKTYDEKHKSLPFHAGKERTWVKDWSARTPFHYRDGVRIWVSQFDLTPDDTFI